MTVREAFDRAGYPVPNGRALSLYLWDYETPRIGFEDSCVYDNDAWVFEKAYGQWGWFPHTLCDDHVKIDGVNIDHLPAIDAYDVLPDVVKEILKEKQNG